MPTLQVRNLPKELYDKLLISAKAERRSLAQQTIVLLEIALRLKETQQRRREVLERLLARPSIPNVTAVDLVREDRDR